MKSEDLRKVVMRMTDDGISSRQIARELRNMVSDCTVRRWQHLNRRTGSIDLNVPIGRPRIVRTKQLIQNVKQRFTYPIL